MKTILLFLVFSICSYGAIATIHVVDNSQENPNTFLTLQGAIDAAVANDTIFIQPTGIIHASSTMSKPLVIFGAGRHPNKVNQSLSKVNQLLLYSGSQGSTIQGVFFVFSLTCGIGVQDITIKYCRINSILISGNNFTVENCVIGAQVNSNPAININDNGGARNNILVQNNVLGSAIGGMNGSGCEVRNNLFLPTNVGVNNAFRSNDPGEFVIVENNIFYGQSAENCSNCTFNNNITYLTTQDTLPFGNNAGTNNLIWTEIGFISGPVPSTTILDDFYGSEFDFQLDTGTPGVGDGTDNNDIGLFGGSVPFSMYGEPDIPVVREFTIENTTIPENGMLNVFILLTPPQ